MPLSRGIADARTPYSQRSAAASPPESGFVRSTRSRRNPDRRESVGRRQPCRPVGVFRGREDLESDDLAGPNRPQVADANLDLGAARTAARSLTHRHSNAFAVRLDILRFDRELLPYLELALGRLPRFLNSLVPAAQERVLGFRPLETRVE